MNHLRAQVTALKRELAAAKRKVKPVRVTQAPNERLARADRTAMCYKDYCPCTPPQEGMDSIVCDQLEAGIDVPVGTMIAGRGGREYRRQAAAMGF